jgi:hypothetical protein
MSVRIDLGILTCSVLVFSFSPGKSSREDTVVEGVKGREAVIRVSGAKL